MTMEMNMVNMITSYSEQDLHHIQNMMNVVNMMNMITMVMKFQVQNNHSILFCVSKMRGRGVESGNVIWP